MRKNQPHKPHYSIKQKQKGVFQAKSQLYFNRVGELEQNHNFIFIKIHLLQLPSTGPPGC